MNKSLKQYMSNSQKGVAHYLAILLVVVGIGVGLYLVQNPQVFSPKASGATFVLSKPTVTCNVVNGRSQPTFTLRWTPGTQVAPNATYTVHYRDNQGGRETVAGATQQTSYQIASTVGLVSGHSYGFLVSAPSVQGGTIYSNNAWSDQIHGWINSVCTVSTNPVPPAPPTTPVNPPTTVTPANKIPVTVLESAQGNPPQPTRFYTSKQNEINYLTQKGYVNKGVISRSPAVSESGAVMAKRFTKGDGKGRISYTWAADQADIASLRARGFTESADSDFYVFLTQKPGTIAINRYLSATNATNGLPYFTLSSISVPGATLDKANVFFLYPYP